LRNIKVKGFLLVFFLASLIFLALPRQVEAQIYEDFTTYTEINDGSNHINLIGTNHIDSTLKRNDDNCSLFYDYGTAYFENFTHYLDIRVNQKGNSDFAFLWALSNDLDDWKGLLDNSKTALGIGAYDSYDNPYVLSIREVHSGVQYISDWTTAQINIWYYLIIRKTGTAFTMEAFSDSGRTTSVYNFSLTLQANHKFKYVFGCMSYNSGNDIQSDHDIENLALVSPLRAITFYYTDYGTFRLNCSNVSNGTTNIYTYNDTIEFSALPFNATCLFLNFTYGASYNDTNPYNYTVTSNETVWCLFEDPPYGKLAPPVVGVSVQVLFIGACVLAGFLAIPFFLIRRKKR